MVNITANCLYDSQSSVKSTYRRKVETITANQTRMHSNNRSSLRQTNNWTTTKDMCSGGSKLIHWCKQQGVWRIYLPNLVPNNTAPSFSKPKCAKLWKISKHLCMVMLVIRFGRMVPMLTKTQYCYSKVMTIGNMFNNTAMLNAISYRNSACHVLWSFCMSYDYVTAILHYMRPCYMPYDHTAWNVKQPCDFSCFSGSYISIQIILYHNMIKTSKLL